jgi:hypothetical protein
VQRSQESDKKQKEHKNIPFYNKQAYFLDKKDK